MINMGFGSESHWKGVWVKEGEINSQKVLVEDAMGMYDLLKFNLMSYRRLSYECCKLACSAFGITVRKKGTPKCEDYVIHLVDHFFKDEHPSAKKLMVWHCSGTAPVSEEVVPEDVLDCLDPDNRKHFEVDKNNGNKIVVRCERPR